MIQTALTQPEEFEINTEMIRANILMRIGRWLKKLSYFLLKLDSSDHAYAQFLTYENLKTYGVSEKIFHCPADPNGGTSYGINGNLVGKRWSDVGKDELGIADSDHYVFTNPDQLAKRHRNKAFAVKRKGVLAEVRDDRSSDGKSKDGRSKDGRSKDDGQITICHQRGTPSEQTLTITKDDLAEHVGHGDTIGACDGKDDDDD